MDVSELSMTADSSGIRVGTKDLRDLAGQSQKTENEVEDLGEEIKKTGSAAQTAGKQFEGMGRNANRATRAAGGYAGGMRNLGLQLNQVAQQGAVTGDYLTAMAIQLPDILISFGTLGVFAGIAAGALVPFASSLLESATSANRLEESTDNLSEALKNLESAKNGVDLEGFYGRAADLMKRASGQELELSVAAAGKALEENMEALVALTPAMESLFKTPREDLVAMWKQIGEAGTLVHQFEGGWNLVTQAILNVRDSLGLTVQEATRFVGHIAAAQRMTDNLEKSRYLQDAADRLQASAIASGNLTDNVMAAIVALRNAAKAAATLGNEMDEAARKAADLLQLQQMSARFAASAATGSGRGADPRSFDGRTNGEFRPSKEVIKQADILLGLRDPDSSRGGGGLTEAEKQHREYLKESNRILNSLRTPMEEYNDKLAALQSLHNTINKETGDAYLNQEQYNAALEKLNRTMPNALGSIEDFSKYIDGELSGAFRSVISGAQSAGSAIKQFVENVLVEAANRIAMNSFGGNLSDSLASWGISQIDKLFPQATPQRQTVGSGLTASTATAQASAYRGGTGGGTTVVNITSQQDETITSSQAEGNIDIQIARKAARIVADDITRNGVVAKSISNTFNVGRKLGGG